jgi:uncharacterized C2H2 Zn-finger protein
MRVKAENSGTVAKLFDFRCPKCNEVFEDMATRAQIDNKEIVHGDCGVPAEKLFSAPLVNSHSAAAWRR